MIIALDLRHIHISMFTDSLGADAFELGAQILTHGKKMFCIFRWYGYLHSTKLYLVYREHEIRLTFKIHKIMWKWTYIWLQ